MKNTYANKTLELLKKIDLQAIITALAVLSIMPIISIYGDKNSLITPLGSIIFMSLILLGMHLGIHQDEKHLDRVMAKYRKEIGKLSGPYATLGERIKEQVRKINSLKSKKEFKINTALLAAIFRIQYYRAEDIIEGYTLPSVQQLIDVSNLLYLHSHSSENSLSGTISYALYLITGEDKYLTDDSFPTVEEVEAIFADYEKEANAEYYKLLSKYSQLLQAGGISYVQ